MLEADIADAKQRSDRKHGLALDPLAVDIGAVGRLEIGDLELFPGQLDQAMGAGHPRIGKDNVGGR